MSSKVSLQIYRCFCSLVSTVLSPDPALSPVDIGDINGSYTLHGTGPDRDGDGHNRKQWFPVPIPVPV